MPRKLISKKVFKLQTSSDLFGQGYGQLDYANEIIETRQALSQLTDNFGFPLYTPEEVEQEINSIIDVISNLEPKIIVIDTIDEIRVDYANDPLVKTQKIVSKLKEIAQRYEVMIFAISHISKSAAYDGSLDRHSAKGDSSIEQKSDKLIGIRAPNKESKGRVIESIVARDESGFKLKCWFNHETFRFVQAID